MKKILKGLCFLLLLGTVVSAWIYRPISASHTAIASANLPDVIPLREFYANQDARYGFGLSGDGKKLTWLEIKWFKPILRIKDIKSGEVQSVRPPKGFTSYMWAADRKTILFTVDKKGWEHQQIAAIDTSLQNSEIRFFDFGEKTTAFVYHISKWPSEKVVIAHNGEERGKFEIYNLDLVTGETEPFGVQAEAEITYAIGDNDEIISRTVLADLKDSNWSLQVQNEEKKWEEIATGDYRDKLFFSGQPNEDGTILALSNRSTDKISFVNFNLRNGGETVIHSDPDVDLSSLLLHPQTKKPLAAISYPGYQKIHFFDQEFEKDLTSVDRPDESAIYVAAQTEDARQLLVNIETAEGDKETVLVDRETGKTESISIAPIYKYRDRLSPVKPVWITARDGLEFQAFLSRPKGVGGAVPLVIMVHGGPITHVGWGHSTLRAMLNNRGYAVLDVNYRGSTGYGRAFVEAAKGEIAGKMSSDLIDARAWAVEQGFADPDKVAIFGGSWGGFEVLTALSQNSDLFAAGISINGVADLSTMLDEVPDFWRGWREWLTEYGADPNTKEGREYLLHKSPITHASKITTPLLMVQGTNDARVVQGQSDRMIEQLRKANAPVEYELVDGVGHLLGSWSWQKRYLLMRQVEYFLAEHLGGRTGGYDYALIGAHVLPE